MFPEPEKVMELTGVGAGNGPRDMPSNEVP
jgi:hypothetical protein